MLVRGGGGGWPGPREGRHVNSLEGAPEQRPGRSLAQGIGDHDGSDENLPTNLPVCRWETSLPSREAKCDPQDGPSGVTSRLS